ncbi:MAG: hypothetical protein SPF17_06605 [Candidatus Mucispirillum faecigallinarum]|nr:hypothetical protein [Candidatus Mucispirillum faecigallinarum]
MLLMFYGCADDSKDSSNINNSSITSESDNSSSSSGDEIINPDDNSGNSGNNTDTGNDEVTNPDENTGSTGSSDDISSLPNIPPLEAETQRYIILNSNGGPGGLDRDKVYYKNNNVDYPTLNGNTVPLMSLYTFSLGQEYWEEYFKERGIIIE